MPVIAGPMDYKIAGARVSSKFFLVQMTEEATCSRQGCFQMEGTHQPGSTGDWVEFGSSLTSTGYGPLSLSCFKKLKVHG